MYAKNALSNLRNRYKAVLKKCHLLNTFGSLAIASMLVLSGATLFAPNAFAIGEHSADYSENTVKITSPNISANASNGTTIFNTANSSSVRVAGGIASAIMEHALDGTSGTVGDSGSVTANNNSLTTNTEVNYSFGGYAYSYAYIGSAGTATANNNTYIVNGTTAKDVFGGYAITEVSRSGGSSPSGVAYSRTAIANFNTLIVNGNLVGASATGGNTNTILGFSATTPPFQAAAENAIANSNNVVINGSVTLDVLGGDAGTQTDHSNNLAGTATASYNTVTINGTVGRNSFGGRASTSSGNSSEESHGYATASYNTVNVNGATLGEENNVDRRGHVIGGLANVAKVLDNTAPSGPSYAEYNTINLSGAVQFLNAGAIVAGGQPHNENAAGQSGSDDFALTRSENHFKGNTLNLIQYTGSKIGTVGNFQNYNFTLPANVQAGSTALQVGSLYLDDGNTLSATVTGINIADSANTLKAGDTITLIDADNIYGSFTNNGTATGKEGSFIDISWGITTVANDKIEATFQSRSLSSSANSTGASFATSQISVLNASTSAFSSVGMPAATEAVTQARQKVLLASNSNVIPVSEEIIAANAPFVAFQGTMSNIDSSVDSDIDTLSFMGGLVHNSYYPDSSELTLGAFVETGTGSHSSTSVSGSSVINGHGSMNYFGFGAFGKYELDMAKLSSSSTLNLRPYGETSIHLGRIGSNYYSNNTPTATGGLVSYETRNVYLGLHAGVGFVMPIDEKMKLDTSFKYFYNFVPSENVNIGGTNFEFDGIHSNKLRLGAKLNYDTRINDTLSFSPYGGLAFEYQMDNDVKAKITSFTMNTTNDGGVSAIANIGFRTKNINGLTVSMGLEGSLGYKDSVMGSLEFKYAL